MKVDIQSTTSSYEVCKSCTTTLSGIQLVFSEMGKEHSHAAGVGDIMSSTSYNPLGEIPFTMRAAAGDGRSNGNNPSVTGPHRGGWC